MTLGGTALGTAPLGAGAGGAEGGPDVTVPLVETSGDLFDLAVLNQGIAPERIDTGAEFYVPRVRDLAVDVAFTIDAEIPSVLASVLSPPVPASAPAGYSEQAIRQVNSSWPCPKILDGRPYAGGECDRVLVDTIWLDTQLACSGIGGSVTGAVDLDPAEEYEVDVDGSFTVYGSDGSSSAFGDPIPIVYPSPGATGGQTLAVKDADVTVADSTSPGPYPEHSTALRMKTAAADAWDHIEPTGGPYSTRVEGKTYTFPLGSGQGEPLRARIHDTPCDDNSGLFRLRVYRLP